MANSAGDQARIASSPHGKAVIGIMPVFYVTNLVLPTNILFFRKTLSFFKILWYNIKNNG
jgi:hypothetical protein